MYISYKVKFSLSTIFSFTATCGHVYAFQHNWNTDRIISTSSITSKPTPARSVTTELPCVNTKDPSKGMETSCARTNGAMISVASHDISNTGSLKEPYPRTKGLPRALIDIIGAPLSTASQAWGYTFTDASSDVVICQSVTYNDIGGTTSVPTCAGTSATESFAPHSTVQIGIHSQNVGTLIGEALYTSVSSALNSLCPSPSPEGTLTGCSNSSVAIPDVPYSDGGTKSGGGDLNITVQSSMYHNSTIREMMIIAAALVANTTAQNQNCWNGTMQEGYDGNANGWASPREIRAVFCNAADFAGVQFLEGGHISNYLDVQWIYDAWTGNNFDCDDMTSMVETVLEATVPEAALGEIPVGLGFEVFCNEAFNHTLG